jgi:hypothetical protein
MCPASPQKALRLNDPCGFGMVMGKLISGRSPTATPGKVELPLKHLSVLCYCHLLPFSYKWAQPC